MRLTRFGIGTALVGGGLNVLLSIIRHPPHVLYIVGWALLVVGLLVVGGEIVRWLRSGRTDADVELGRRAIRLGRRAQQIAAHGRQLDEAAQSQGDFLSRRGVGFFRETMGDQWHELLADLREAGHVSDSDVHMLDVTANLTGLVTGNGGQRVAAIGRRLLRERGISPEDEDQP